MNEIEKDWAEKQNELENIDSDIPNKSEEINDVKNEV